MKHRQGADAIHASTHRWGSFGSEGTSWEHEVMDCNSITYKI
jgi:hypothetical protein